MKEDLFSQYFETTPDINKYLERINYDAKVELSLDCLNALIEAHQKAVPFENADVFEYHLPISLDMDTLYNKIVLNHRGGYCFENNTSFLSLLRAIGFDARPCMCRIANSKTDLSPIRHKATIVTFDNQEYFVDVGCGAGMCTKAVPIGDGVSVTTNNETFSFEHFKDTWWLLYITSPYLNINDGVLEPETRLFITVSTHLCVTDDFVPYNYCCWQPYSMFYAKRNIALRTDDGFVKLSGNSLIKLKNDKITIEEISEDKIKDVYREVFGIVISPEYIENRMIVINQ